MVKYLMKGALTMQITAIGACDDFHMASRWAEPGGGIDELGEANRVIPLFRMSLRVIKKSH